jgi:hypothetical protein
VEELEEVTFDEVCALHVRESVEATAQEVDALVLVRQNDEAMTAVKYSPDPDVRLIRNSCGRGKGCWNEYAV